MLQVRPLPLLQYQPTPPGVPHADPHRPEALPVRPMRPKFQTETASQEAPELVPQPQLYTPHAKGKYNFFF